MSRETDSPSSGPHGRGGTAYPSGTPPYGTPLAADGGTDAGRAAGRPDERKTETTLTTRVRINIPGSRPIPPVVVRKPVGGAEDGAADGEGTGAEAPGSAASAGAAEPPAAPAQPAEEKATSDWFAPRRSPSAKGGPGGPANGAGAAGGSGPSGAGLGPGTAGAGLPGATGGRPGGPNGPGGSNGAGLPGATGGPVAPGHGGGTGSFDVTEALTGGPLGKGSHPGTGQRRDDPPYASPNGQSAPNGPAARDGRGGPGAPDAFLRPGDPTGPQGPAGPTAGPVTGDGRLTPSPGGGPGTSGGLGAPGASNPSGGTGRPGGSGAPGGLRGPGSSPAGPGAPRPGGGLSDDTAVLTPQKPAPERGGPGYGTPADNVSGHTVTSGFPAVPGDRQGPFGPGSPADGPRPHTPPKAPEPASPPPAGSAKPKPPKKKGRSKLVLLSGGVVVLAGVAYGAGLLMNHSDVPKGTTVLGVDIGGGTRDDAVEKLDAAFGDRVDKPLELTVGGDTVTLKPEQAGLQFDTQATVGVAAKSDYNPVSVIGSLFGNHRVVDPVMPVDEEKLHAALRSAAGGAGSVTEGTIRFEPGKAVPVYGKPGTGIDVAKSAEAMEKAFRAQVETGTSSPVNVPTTTRQPTVSKAEVDRMMKEFAEPAMSANVTVQTDAAHAVPMSPQKSLWKFLRVTAVDGKLVDKPDLAALEGLYGQAFDGVLITRGNGKKTPVTPEDVYAALRQALTSETDRVAVIETNPS
ncbi:hypothetical protein SUDANB6_02112 [Streptomyces sp. enrichment culture]|uniref:hypothetical protein n=1 Tax=Streptomyces sp. enrichment culture TaxID=1795815 RepID=UPI003F578422